MAVVSGARCRVDAAAFLEATAVAARIGDGFITMSPEPDLLAQYDKEGGRGPKSAGVKGCWAADVAEARRTAMRWANEALPGNCDPCCRLWR